MPEPPKVKQQGKKPYVAPAISVTKEGRGGHLAPLRPKVELEKAKKKKGMSDKTKALVEAKHAVDNALTPEQKRSVLAEEETYRDRHTETGSIITPNGKIAAHTVKGSSNRASFLRRDIVMYGKDAVLTHNHPDQEYDSRGHYKGGGRGMGARIGSSLSGADIQTAAIADAKEMRANTPTYTFSIKRGKNGWGASPETLGREWDREFTRQSSSLRAHANLINRSKTYNIGGKEYDGQTLYHMEWGRMNALASHRATQAIAKKYGLEYTRTKRHERSAHDTKMESSGKANTPRQPKLPSQKQLEALLRKLRGGQ